LISFKFALRKVDKKKGGSRTDFTKAETGCES